MRTDRRRDPDRADGAGGARDWTGDVNLAARLESLEQNNNDLKNRLRDLEKRIQMVTNPEVALRIQGYIDFGFSGSSEATDRVSRPTRRPTHRLTSTPM